MVHSGGDRFEGDPVEPSPVPDEEVELRCRFAMTDDERDAFLIFGSGGPDEEFAALMAYVDAADSPEAAEYQGRTLGVVFDDLLASDRAIASATAVRTRLIDEARVLSELSGQLGGQPSGQSSGQLTQQPSFDPSQVRRWSSAAVARRSLVAEIGCLLRVPDRTAENLIEQANALLHSLPVTFDALTDGSITYRHAEVIIDQVWSLPTDRGDQCDSADPVAVSAVALFERIAVPLAAELTVAKFSRKARILREHTHPHTIETRYRAAVDDRSVRIDPATDGMSWLSAYLPAVHAQGIYNRISSIASSLAVGRAGAPDASDASGADAGSGSSQPADSRTLAQLRADVFTDLLIYGTCDADATSDANPTTDADASTGFDPSTNIGGTATAVPSAPRRRFTGSIGDGIRATVMITVPVLSLLGHSEQPASLEGFGPIDLPTARQLTAEAPSLIRILTHPETGAILSVGRTRYTIPNDLRLWLRIRDVTCRYPGCGVSAHNCDLDHTIAWQHGGRTDHTNLAHLCPAHHNLKHHTNWTLKQNDAGILAWTSPTTHTFTSKPGATI